MRKLQTIRAYLANNRLRWTCYFILLGFIKRVSKLLSKRLKSLEMRYKLPGDNTIARNYAGWQNHDWWQKGEEWTPSVEWKQSLIDEVLLRYIEPGKTILEIGPGAGRWTETLQRIAKRLIIVDLSDKCIEICKRRFSHCDNIEFFVNDGRNLSFLTSESVDFIWSFDVFVHINAWDTEKYLMESKRVLRKEGHAVIHHPKERGSCEYEDYGWRSNTSAKLFNDMLKRHGLKLISQFDSWGKNEEFDVKRYHDVITVFKK